MNKILVSLIIAGAAVGVFAQSPPPYFVRGTFNGWTNSTDPMVDMGGGKWSYVVNGLTPGVSYQFKATTDDWSFNAPASNIEAVAGASGQLVVNFFPNISWSDGWSPTGGPRAGYEDPGYGWEIMGSFNGWSSPVLSLTPMGGGLFTGQMSFAPGSYEFKFRKAGDWGANVGNDFGNGSNIPLTVTDSNPIQFMLDLPNGRWDVNPVPEPATMAALGAGLAAVAARRRRRRS